MSDNIIEIYVDPILGNDVTGKPIEDKMTIYFYKSIDGAIEQLGDIEDKKLIINVSGEGSMNNLKYKNIIINKWNETSKLIINGRVNKSIELQNIILNIDTTIIIPADDSRIDSVDVPVIISTEIFKINNGNELNVIDTIINNQINRPRVIIKVNGNIIIENNGGRINLSHRDSRFISGGKKICLGNFDKLITTDRFILVESDDTNKKINLNFSDDLEWKIHKVNEYYSSKRILARGFGLGLSLIFKIVTSILILPFGPVVRVGMLGNNISTNLNNNIDLVLFNSSVSKTEGESNKDFLNGINLINESPADINSYVSNYPLQLTDSNLVNSELFVSNESYSDMTSDYDINLNYGSTFKDGSTFEKINLIKSDYIHDKFDGTIFAVDASNQSILITIPIEVLENRKFIYKRIDNSNNDVIIKTPNGIDNKKGYSLKNKCKYLAYVSLIGYNKKLWII